MWDKPCSISSLYHSIYSHIFSKSPPTFLPNKVRRHRQLCSSVLPPSSAVFFGSSSIISADLPRPSSSVCVFSNRLARHNIESSPDQSEVVPKKKQPTKRAAVGKKKATITEISDDEDEDGLELSDDSDFEVVKPPSEEKKKGRKPAAAKATKPPTGATKKRGSAKKNQQPASGQKLITDVLKPVAEASPEKKVRKMRPSHKLF